MSNYCRKCVFGEDGPPDEDSCAGCHQEEKQKRLAERRKRLAAEKKWKTLRAYIRSLPDSFGLEVGEGRGLDLACEEVLTEMDRLDREGA